MGERALKFAVGREIGMDVAGSLAVLADRKSKFMICVKLTSFSVRDHALLALWLCGRLFFAFRVCFCVSNPP
jgi:hypothetical protein